MRNKKQKFLLIFFGLILSLFAIEASLRIVGYIVNLKQIRKHNISRHSSDEAFKILCLGDSFTFGLGASYDYGYPRQLERILNKNNPQKKFIVYNRGIPGQNSSQLLKMLDKNIIESNPDVILVMVGTNNDPNFGDSNYWLFANIKDLGMKRYILTKMDYFLTNLRSYELIKTLILNLKNKITLGVIEDSSAESPKEPVESEAILEMSMDQDSEEVQGHLNLAETYLDNRKFELAIQQIGKALSINPKNERGHLLLARAYRKEEKYDMAKLAIDKAMKVNPGNYRAYLELGNIYYYQARNRPDIIETNFKLAIENLKRAIELNPNNQQAYLSLAGVYDEQGRKDLAAKTAKSLLGIYPTNGEQSKVSCFLSPPVTAADRRIFDRVLKYDLENIIRLTEGKGIKTILLNYPDVSFQDDIRRAVAEANKVKFIEIFSVFKELLKEYNWKELFSDDGTHCNAKGYKVIAEEIYKTLKSDGELGIK